MLFPCCFCLIQTHDTKNNFRNFSEFRSFSPITEPAFFTIHNAPIKKANTEHKKNFKKIPIRFIMVLLYLYIFLNIQIKILQNISDLKIIFTLTGFCLLDSILQIQPLIRATMNRYHISQYTFCHNNFYL